MAAQLQIIDNALVVTNSTDGTVLLDAPTKDLYYLPKELDDTPSIVKLYDLNGTNPSSSTLFSRALNETQDENGTTFTKQTFRAFARQFLGNRTGGGNGRGVVNQNHVFSGANRTAAENERDTFFNNNPNQRTNGLQILLSFGNPEQGVMQFWDGNSWVDLGATLTASEIQMLAGITALTINTIPVKKK